MRFLIVLLFISLKAHAGAWYVDDVLFSATDELYASGPGKLQQASLKIKKHIDFLLKNYFPHYKEEVIFTFESTKGVDAIFYPPLTYDGRTGLFKDRPVISLNPRLINDAKMYRLVGHEFFHAVHYSNAPNEVDWIREGLAQKFEAEVYGGITHSHVRAAMEDSRHALEENFDIASVKSERYGNTFLFFHFMEDHCGVEKVWSYFLQQQAVTVTGRDSIDSVLKTLKRALPHCQNALDLMGHFILAKLINLRGNDFSRALWPLLSPMPVMRSEAYALASLTPAEIRQFLSSLPPFLGLKLPVGVWTPPVSTDYLERQGVVLKLWKTVAGKGQLLDWDGETINNSSGEFILIYKKR